MDENPENGIKINLISSRKLDSMTSQEKLRFILDQVKDGVVLVLERGLTAVEEIDLIKSTMGEIDHDTFIGIEMQSYSPDDLEAGSWFSRILGRTRVPKMSVIGPASLLKPIRKNGNIIQAMILTGKAIRQDLPEATEEGVGPETAQPQETSEAMGDMAPPLEAEEPPPVLGDTPLDQAPAGTGEVPPESPGPPMTPQEQLLPPEQVPPPELPPTEAPLESQPEPPQGSPPVNQPEPPPDALLQTSQEQTLESSLELPPEVPLEAPTEPLPETPPAPPVEPPSDPPSQPPPYQPSQAPPPATGPMEPEQYPPPGTEVSPSPPPAEPGPPPVDEGMSSSAPVESVSNSEPAPEQGLTPPQQAPPEGERPQGTGFLYRRLKQEEE
ncbi:DUF2073 domain-containing protein [[Eubacterium] cellulosolvens]